MASARTERQKEKALNTLDESTEYTPEGKGKNKKNTYYVGTSKRKQRSL